MTKHTAPNDPAPQHPTGYWEEEIDPNKRLTTKELCVAFDNARITAGLPPEDKPVSEDEMRRAVGIGVLILAVGLLLWFFFA